MPTTLGSTTLKNAEPPRDSAQQPLLPINSRSTSSVDDIPSRTKVVLRVLRLAVPMGLSFTFSFSLVASAVMIGQLGNEEDQNNTIASIPLITTSLQTVTLLIGSSLYAMSLQAGKHYGRLKKVVSSDDYVVEVEPINPEEEKEAIRNIFHSGLIWSTIVTPFAMTALYNSETILTNLLGQNPGIAATAAQYLRTYTWAIPGYMLRMSTEQMLFTYGKTLHAMGISLTSFSLATALGAFLAFGPANLGIPGVAIGYVAEAYLTSLGFSAFLGFHKDYRSLELFNIKAFSKKAISTLLDVLKIGLPITAQLSFDLVAAQLYAVFAGWLGTEELAAYGISNQLLSITIIPIIAFGQSVMQEVSRSMGRDRFNYASRFARYGLLTSLGLISPIALTFGIKPDWLISMMSRHSLPERTLSLAYKTVPIAAASVMADTVRYGEVQFLRTAGRPYLPTFFSIMSIAVGLLVGYLLSQTDLGVVGLEIGALLGISLAAVIISPLWGKGTQSESLKLVEQQRRAPSSTQGFSFRDLFSNCPRFQLPLFSSSSSDYAEILDEYPNSPSSLSQATTPSGTGAHA